MEEIDRLQYNPGVVFLSSFYTITASLKVEEHVIAMNAAQQELPLTYHFLLGPPKQSLHM